LNLKFELVFVKKDDVHKIIYHVK